jgi:hypothetical protein
MGATAARTDFHQRLKSNTYQGGVDGLGIAAPCGVGVPMVINVHTGTSHGVVGPEEVKPETLIAGQVMLLIFLLGQPVLHPDGPEAVVTLLHSKVVFPPAKMIKNDL